METDEYCVEKVSFYQLNLLRLDVAMTLIYTQYLAPFLNDIRLNEAQSVVHIIRFHSFETLFQVKMDLLALHELLN